MTTRDTVSARVERYRPHTIALAGIILVGVVLARRPWIGEDVHITLRTVDNFVNGYGLRWNIDERVQTFTHPLWLFIISACYSVTREIYFTISAICCAFSLAAFLVLARAARSTMVVVVLAVLMCCSQSLVNFTTSGFENPLTNFLLSLFAATLFKQDEAAQPAWWKLSLIAALAATNRLDTALLFVPIFIYLIMKSRPHARQWMGMLLGSIPLLTWLLFSLFYYGFFFPNTAAAKLSPHIALIRYINSGVRDLVALFCLDRASALIVFLGIVGAVLSLVSSVRNRADYRRGCLAALGLGLLLSYAYTIRVGGDFIVGRFWIANLWMSLIMVALGARDFWRWWATLALSRRVAGAAAAMLVFGAINIVVSHFLVPRFWGPAAILAAWRREGMQNSLERSIGRAELQLDHELSWKITPMAMQWKNTGEAAARRSKEGGGRVLVASTIGFTGLAAGRDVVVIDLLALGDPLLARLPPVARTIAMSGHLKRRLPTGYLQARETGSLEKMAPAMRAYYEKLRLVTSGPLWSRARLKAIVALHTGAVSAPVDYEWDKAVSR